MQAVLDGAAAEKEKAGLEEHMTLCRDCAREFNAFQASLKLLVSMPAPEPSPGFTSDTVKKAFMAKRDQMRRQKIVSWCLSGLTAIVSVFLITGWNMVLQPAIRTGLSSILSILLEWRILFKAFDKVLSALAIDLVTSGNHAVRIILEGCPPVFSGYLIALIIMVFYILITGVKSSAFSFKRR